MGGGGAAQATGSEQVKVVNDADAAGAAEMSFGAGSGVRGTVLMCTFGTGIGTAIFVDGKLVPNTELGCVSGRGWGPGLESRRANAEARLDHEVPAGWASPSSRGTWVGDALLITGAAGKRKGKGPPDEEMDNPKQNTRGVL